MNIRTTSQLPSADFNPLDWIGISKSVGDNTYVSRKLLCQNLKDAIKDTTVNFIVDKYNLNDADTEAPIDVNALFNDMQRLESQDYQLSGIKQFSSWPCISADFPPTADDSTNANDVYGDDYQFAIPNIKIVKSLVEDSALMMSTADSQVAEGNPLPQHIVSNTDNSVVESLDYAHTIGSGKFYFWHIDGQRTDSSESIADSASGSVDGYEEMRDTGNLVVWGWLAENIIPPPEPEQCWVALYAKLKCENYNDTQLDVPVQVRPWIRGKNASSIQYVSFNIPVKKGLRLKIKTGFPVNDQNSGLQRPGSLTFLDQGIPNAFFGYVIK